MINASLLCMARGHGSLWASASLFLACILTASGAHAADRSLANLLLSERALAQAVRRGEISARTADADGQPIAGEVAESKSHALPALEILGFQFLLNRLDKLFIGSDYNVSLSSVRRNLRSSWVVDSDPFEINQFAHPYQGSMYYGFARSAGMNFWESFGYAFAGSAVWEIAGETTRPSRNDQITTSIAGSFLGESLYRMANLVLEREKELPSTWRELAAAAIAPSAAFNRAAFPKDFGKVFSSRSPALYSQLQVGGNATLKQDAGTSRALKRNETIADFSLDYGLPGKPGYRYDRPFDYFSFSAQASNERVFETVNNRGLILGAPYEAGERFRGIWGLYGSYDYLAPQLFRLSSTALSLGTTGQWSPSSSLTLQGTATAGMGYTSTGTISGTAAREYNYGVAPQALLQLKAIFGKAVSLEVSARDYFAGRLDNADPGATDRVLRAEASLTFRIKRRHAVSLRYVSSRRNFFFTELGDRSQRRDTIGIYYTYLGSDGFGRVSW